ncbi:alpha/beta-hydrolase family protein [Nonomuraea sp. NPDC050310]|uniref:alpha/beta hydrolase n=1 Tax=Nonomuraea sp. NPDC050310 TaxID=3154935 RepID=UPI0033E64029
MTSKIISRRPDLTGLALALVFFCLSLTPSLLPRPWAWQGVVGGITAAIGYTLGVLAATCYRAARSWIGPPPRRPAIDPGRVLTWAAAVAIPVSLIGGAHAQGEVRRLIGVEQVEGWELLLVPLLAALVAAAFVLAARLARLAVRALISLLARVLPRRAAVAAGFTLGVALLTLVVWDLLLGSLINRTAAGFGLADGTTPPGITRPPSGLLAGGPGSLTPWETLGREGRIFVAHTPDAGRIAAFTGRPAKHPIRVYAGLGSAASPAQQAGLVVRELHRTGAFDRKILVVAASTGTGWVNQKAAQAVEYLHGGDTAIAAMQYSYLPSWISFLVDRSRAREAAGELFAAVRREWARLPVGDRPRLLVYGESLGAFGIEGALREPDTLLTQAQGALLVGSPRYSPIHRQVLAGRDPGSPVWRPVYRGGRHIRTAQHPADLTSAATLHPATALHPAPGLTATAPPRPPRARVLGEWEQPRVAYLQNASDPVVWWEPELLYQRPDWLRAPVGPDVNPRMSWWPIITFWQVLADLVAAADMPPGHGHDYGTAIPAGWVAVAAPEGWTAADSARLQALIAQVRSGQ